jgi:hypothetical protein
MDGLARVLLAKAYYSYTSNQRPASHARALSGATASIPDPALSVSLAQQSRVRVRTHG